MEHQRGEGPTDGSQERLRRLEERVDALERAADDALRARRRSRLLMLLGFALYVLVIYWELRSIV